MTQTIENRLAQLGISLGPPPPAAGAYVATLAVGELIFTSGQVATTPTGGLLAQGRLGAEVDLDTGIACARQCAVNVLAQVNAALDGLDRIRRVVKVTVYVASDPAFTEQPQVANGASSLFNEVLGTAGIHVRSAVGVAALPAGSPVEVEAILEIAI